MGDTAISGPRQTVSSETHKNVQRFLAGQPKPERKTFTVFGNYGQLTCDSATGEVLEYDGGSDGDTEYADIVCMDVQEWREHYPGEEPDTMDILDIGFWAINERAPTGEYEKPDEDWRKDFLMDRAHFGSCPEDVAEARAAS